MANSYFQFEKFIIRQDRCARKVGTDSVILGCLADLTGVGTVLDVGAGTGLLSILLATRSAEIAADAVEIDQQAARQAEENIKENGLEERIRVIAADFREFSPEKRYDLVISNPPYFTRGPGASSKEREISRYTSTLPHLELLEKAARLLAPAGSVAVCLPHDAYGRLEPQLADIGLRPVDITCVRPSPSRPFYLAVATMKDIRSEDACRRQEQAIRDEDGFFSAWYRALTEKVYLRNKCWDRRI